MLSIYIKYSYCSNVRLPADLVKGVSNLLFNHTTLLRMIKNNCYINFLELF